MTTHRFRTKENFDIISVDVWGHKEERKKSFIYSNEKKYTVMHNNARKDTIIEIKFTTPKQRKGRGT